METLKLTTTYLFKEKVLHNKLAQWFGVFLVYFVSEIHELEYAGKDISHFWNFNHNISTMKTVPLSLL